MIYKIWLDDSEINFHEREKNVFRRAILYARLIKKKCGKAPLVVTLKYVDFILFIGTNECVTKQKSVQKKSWCKEEETITLKVFEKHFKSTSLPGKAECQEVQKEYPILRTRHWDHLKHKVRKFNSKVQKEIWFQKIWIKVK